MVGLSYQIRKGAQEHWGVFQNAEFTWNLKIKPEASFRSGLKQGSNLPRFDERLLPDKKGNSFINPFTG